MGLTDIMDDEMLYSYVAGRLLHPDGRKAQIQLKQLKGIRIHNAFSTNEVAKILEGADLEFERYTPKESAEQHLYVPQTGKIHLANSRDPVRLERDQDLGIALRHLIKQDDKDRKIKVDISYRNNDPYRSFVWFTEKAIQVTNTAFEHIPDRELLKTKRLHVIMGPFKAFDFDGCKVEYESHNDYVNFKVMRIADEWVLSLDYVFANQAENIMSNVLGKIASYRSGVGVNLMHYGKVGGMNPEDIAGQFALKLGAIGLPSGYIDENEMRDFGRGSMHSLPNLVIQKNGARAILEDVVNGNIHEGITLNTVPILRQKRKHLKDAQEYGCTMLDMEWGRIGTTALCVSSTYPGIGEYRVLLAGAVSDLPLEGKTLADGTDAPRHYLASERSIASAYKRMIQKKIPELK